MVPSAVESRRHLALITSPFRNVTAPSPTSLPCLKVPSKTSPVACTTYLPDPVGVNWASSFCFSPVNMSPFANAKCSLPSFNFVTVGLSASASKLLESGRAAAVRCRDLPAAVVGGVCQAGYAVLSSADIELVTIPSAVTITQQCQSFSGAHWHWCVSPDAKGHPHDCLP